MAKLFWVLLLLLGLAAGAAWEGQRFLQSPSSSVDLYKLIEVPQGSSFRSVAETLYQANLISNRFYFQLLARWTGSDKKIKSGEYSLHTAMPPMEVLDALVMGRVLLQRVVTPEGLTAGEIGEILQEAGFGPADRFHDVVHDSDVVASLGIDGKSLEGYLFPDTYQFARRTTAVEIAKRMVNQFQSVYGEAFRSMADERGMTQREVVVLASIIEKETARPSERELISAVFHNRLKQNMPLQADPTVIFGLENFNGKLTRRDLDTPSPYNTYLNRGLPIGPISNPGRETIYAALHPAKVDYLYFVSKNDGTHQFSRTLSDHNEAVIRYQRRKGAASGE